MREVFATTPSKLRTRADRADAHRASGGIALRLPFRAPLEADGLLDFLGLRAVPGVEEVADGAFRRTLRLPNGGGVVELRPADGHIRARFWLDDLRDLAVAVPRCRSLLDLDSDPEAVERALASADLLGPLVKAAPGRRVAGHVDGHELAFRAVLGQQVSLPAAATLTRRLVAAHGEPLAHPRGSLTHIFPSAQALAEADPESWPMPTTRRKTLRGLASALAGGELMLDVGVDRGESRRRLRALPGIGPWTIDYIAMRALRDPDAFLAGDLGVGRALRRLGHDGRPAAAARIAERWRPYRSYAVQHLWASLAAPPTVHRVAEADAVAAA